MLLPTCTTFTARKVDATDEKGCTALHHAASHGSLNCLHLLLAAGASATVVDSAGSTPLKVAEENHRTPIIEALKQALIKVRHLGEGHPPPHVERDDSELVLWLFPTDQRPR